MQKKSAVLLGAGSRGLLAYGPYARAHPEELEFVAVAEPQPGRRERFAAEHGIPPERQFDSWEALLAEDQLADLLFNCTMDQMHTASTLAAIKAGYDILLEKPMAHSLLDNLRLAQAADASGRLLAICHVLRYTAFFRTLREILRSGRLGRIINVDHRENLIYWHMAHSFVRGNWRNEAGSVPMLLAKCCHDLDILGWLLGQTFTHVSSFGSLTAFTPEHAPPDAPQRCTDGCPHAEACKFYAPRFYAKDGDGFLLNAVAMNASASERLELLATTSPYGRCVWHCDNTVVDHQTVALETADGTTVTLIMQGHGFEECRTMRYDGTLGTLQARLGGNGGNKITLRDHHSGRSEQIPVQDAASGHGGGDFGIVASFLRAARGEPDKDLPTARESLESHLLAFAAEEARQSRKVVKLEHYRRKANKDLQRALKTR